MNQVVEVSQELDCLKVLPPSIFVGNPLTFPPRIIEIEHGGHSVDPESIQVKSLAPIKCVGREKIPDFVAAKIKNQRAPILVRSLARVFMFIQCRPIKVGKRPIIARKMRRDPIHINSDARLMKLVDQKLEIIRCSIAACRSVKACDLITPTWIVNMLGRWKEFNVRESHVPHIVNQGPGEFSIIEGFKGCSPPPGSEMNLVNADGRSKNVCL